MPKIVELFQVDPKTERMKKSERPACKTTIGKLLR